MDLHADQIQGFYNIPVDNLYARPVLIKYIRENLMDDLVIVSPDAGGAERAEKYAGILNVDYAVIDKRHPEFGVTRAMNVLGEVDGKNALILDDMFDTAGTLVEAVKALLEKGAKKVMAAKKFAGSALESSPLVRTRFFPAQLSNG